MLYQMVEWETPDHVWKCNCVDHLGTDGGHWTHPARILNMPLDAYVKWVIDTYHPQVWHNSDCSLVFFSWKDRTKMRAFKNYINKVSRSRNYQI